MSTSRETPSIEVKGRKTGSTYRVSSMEDFQRLLRDGELDSRVFSFAGKPVDAYLPAWESVFPKPGHTFPLPGLELTEPFYIVYQGVTSAMRNYYRGHPESRLFLEFMIEKFFDEYETWPDGTPDSFARDYLRDWNKSRKGPAYRLIGQAFLHIAWDLPRVVVDCFPMGELERLRISEADAGEHFRATNGIFEDVLFENFKNYKVSGVFAAGGKALKPRSKLLNQVFIWIVATRTDAWVLGSDLAKQSEYRRAQIKKALQAAIKKSAREAQEGPFGWMGLIKPPVLAFSLVPIAEWPAWTKWGPLALIGVIVILYIVDALYRSFEPTLRVAERFGYLLHQELKILIEHVRDPEYRFVENRKPER
jgi:hypothetical protein